MRIIYINSQAESIGERPAMMPCRRRANRDGCGNWTRRRVTFLTFDLTNRPIDLPNRIAYSATFSR